MSVYRTTFNLNAVSLRFSNVYGEGCFHKTSVVSKMAKSAFENRKIVINGDGQQTRDFLPVPLLNKMIFATLLGRHQRVRHPFISWVPAKRRQS